MLLQYCTEYISKFGKLSSGHRTGKGQFSSQSRRRARQKKFKLSYNCAHFPQARLQQYVNKKFQIYKLDLEKTEEPEIILPTFVGSQKKLGSSRQTSPSASLTTLKPLTVWITANWKILQEMGIPDHLTYLLRNLYAGQEATVRTGHEMMDWFQIGKGIHQGCILLPCLFSFYAEYIV